MKHIYMSDEEERQAFARKAAAWFVKHPEHRTYTDGEILPGKWFASKWGLDENCVVVFKIDADHGVTNYQELMREFTVEGEG